MKKYYTTGQFAKKAGTTERTIRYYDKIGLLKPTHILDNGYRQYTEEDLIRLQRIISLQHLGFSLEEIVPLLMEGEVGKDSFKQSIKMQIDIINKKTNHLDRLKEALTKTGNLLEQGEVQWDRIVELIKLSNDENTIIQQYRNTKGLLKRIELHNKFTVNTTPWFLWVYKQLDLSRTNRLLEIGCGNGELWKNNTVNLRHREFFLTDINKNMLEEAKRFLKEDYNYVVMDGENITFKKEYFDIVIANHVLFYLNDVKKGIQEIHRVLKKNGLFYCTAYGREHMQEIEQLVKQYNPDIYLMESNLYEKFGIENGEARVKEYFEEVEFRRYEDELHVDDSQILIDYIMSCPGNQNEILGKDMKAFKMFVTTKIKESGYIRVTKDVGMFICKK